jgi:peptidoglycan/xylan/chitin deacetylase (PgdA/CDA1 family)
MPRMRIYQLIVLLLALAGCGATPGGAPTTGVPGATASATVAPSPETSPTAVASATPEASATAVASATPEASPTPAGLSEAELKRLRPNELGWVLVLEYHLIESPDSQYSRSPEKLRQDLEKLYELGYYPMTFRDLGAGKIDIPAGRSPVVLTFDDSSDGQFRILPDGSVDPTSAWGVLQAFSAEHEDWPLVATFFPLIDVDVPERVLFGQPEHVERKLKEIVSNGGEVGSHSYTHLRLDLATPDEIQWQLAQSARVLEEHIGDGYKVTSLSLPLGMYPADEALIKSGESEGARYEFSAAAEVAGGPSPSPFSRNFDPYHIRRNQALDSEFEWIWPMLEAPGLRYISDGDPDIVTVPVEEALAEQLQGGILREEIPGKTIRRYEP